MNVDGTRPLSLDTFPACLVEYPDLPVTCPLVPCVADGRVALAQARQAGGNPIQ